MDNYFQVSGRAAILSLDKTTVCKPVNYRELRFYKSLPNNIKQFTPRFKGWFVEEIKKYLLVCIVKQYIKVVFFSNEYKYFNIKSLII